VNASPLILLEKIGRIDLLSDEGVDVVVPLTVLHEVSGPGLSDPSDPLVRAIYDAGWEVAPTPAIPASVSQWKLDPGEESVLAVALSCTGCEVVLDDRRGRRCADAHGIPVLGTLAIVVLAKQLGKIGVVRPVIEDLVRAGLYVKENVVTEALKQAGE
jgi:predicted nucleic acid-binding protein